MELDRTQRRILGSLIEKRWSTPDQYPLSLNALVAACNQRSNREPTMDLKEFEVTGALLALRENGLILIREREGGRIPRYAERLTEELALEDRASAVLTELLLRGPQTAGELLRRVPRMVRVESQNQIDDTLAGLASLHLVRLLPREPGQRYPRWTHLLAPAEEVSATASPPTEEASASAAAAPPAPAPAAPDRAPPDRPPPPASPPSPPAPPPVDEAALARREEVEALRARVEDLSERVRRLEDLWR